MEQVATIKFIDLDSKDDAWIFVRADSNATAIGLSLKSSGDYDVSLGVAELDQLIDALQRARVKMKSKS